MKISEIFYSIEGEGTEIGKPEVFIRLAGCNLRCKWCDTEYALGNGEDWSNEEIINEISKYSCKNISITGGEPLLQKEELLKLVKKLKALEYWIQINTNGTIFNKEIFSLTDLVTMDYKCPSSGEKSTNDVLEKTKTLFNHKSQFKFVISDEKDYNYAKNVVLSTFRDATNIIFQPEWDNREFAGKLVELAKKDNLDVKIILQQQKMIWDEKRRV